MSAYECEYCGMPACDCPVVLYREFVAAWDAWLGGTWRDEGAAWSAVNAARAALNTAMDPEHATTPASAETGAAVR